MLLPPFHGWDTSSRSLLAEVRILTVVLRGPMELGSRNLYTRGDRKIATPRAPHPCPLVYQAQLRSALCPPMRRRSCAFLAVRAGAPSAAHTRCARVRFSRL